MLRNCCSFIVSPTKVAVNVTQGRSGKVCSGMSIIWETLSWGSIDTGVHDDMDPSVKDSCIKFLFNFFNTDLIMPSFGEQLSLGSVWWLMGAAWSGH